jgi:hypothetical protein
MIVYRVHYYDEGGGIEMHYPTKKEAFKVVKNLIEKNKGITSIHVEALTISKPTKRNVCFMLDGINFIESKETLLSEEK